MEVETRIDNPKRVFLPYMIRKQLTMEVNKRIRTNKVYNLTLCIDQGFEISGLDLMGYGGCRRVMLHFIE